MDLDDHVCYCFHVPRRKLLTWARLNRPRVPSQLSMCAGAGTGCGWCIPFLKQIFRQVTEATGEGLPTDLDRLTAEEYATQRAAYVREGKGKPPAGAEPVSASPPQAERPLEGPEAGAPGDLPAPPPG